MAQAKAMMKAPRSRLFLVCDPAMTWIPQLNELQRLFDVSFQRVERKDFYPMRITVYARKRSDALKSDKDRSRSGRPGKENQRRIEQY